MVECNQLFDENVDTADYALQVPPDTGIVAKRAPSTLNPASGSRNEIRLAREREDFQPNKANKKIFFGEKGLKKKKKQHRYVVPAEPPCVVTSQKKEPNGKYKKLSGLQVTVI